MNDKAIDRIKTELDTVDTDEAYRDMLNEAYPTTNICGMEIRGRSAELLEETDNFAYRCGYSDWLDGELKDDRWIEVDGEYYDYDDAQRIIDEEEDAEYAEEEESN